MRSEAAGQVHKPAVVPIFEEGNVPYHAFAIRHQRIAA
jgi:hypothetical protein